MSNFFKTFFGLGGSANKLKEGIEKEDGVVGSYQDEMTANISDEELLELTSTWEVNWAEHYASSLKPRQDKNKSFYLKGKDVNSDIGSILGITNNEVEEDNILFEALETYIPEATKQNPEPVVMSDGTEAGDKLAKNIERQLIFLTDKLKLKLKLKRVIYHDEVYFLGCIKTGWDARGNDITIKVIHPKNLILDPDATVEECDYTGEYIGERKKESANTLIARFPEHEDIILATCQGKKGTKIQYTEWWTDEYVCWRLKDKILGKKKNPHWNYDNTKTEENVDEFGTVTLNKINQRGKNHFEFKRKPYVIFVCRSDERPYESTTCLEQNIPNQKKISDRNIQINKNIENINGCWVISMEKAGINENQAEQMAKKLQKGGVAAIPIGLPREAIDKVTGLSLPGEVYNERERSEQKLRNIFGITGLSAQGTAQEKTVRGKIINQNLDASRTGGGVAEYLEQFCDGIFNWMVQLMYVYYDEEHVSAILGGESGKEHSSLINTNFNNKLLVSVKSGSMIPKDSMTKRNTAVDLFGMGGIDPLSLAERMEEPNPRQYVERLVKWKRAPETLIQQQQPPKDIRETLVASGIGTENIPPAPTAPPETPPVPPGDELLNQVNIPK